MTKGPRFLFCILAAGLSLTTPSVAAGASASDGASTTIRLHGVVPTICRASFSASQVTPEGSVVDLGLLSELCNNVGGYRVVLSHAIGVVDGTITIDGLSRPLSPSGLTVITDVSGPAIAQKAVTVDFGSGAPTSLGIMVQPKGPVF